MNFETRNLKVFVVTNTPILESTNPWSGHSVHNLIRRVDKIITDVSNSLQVTLLSNKPKT